jgi:DNA topoisomerase-1
MLVKTTENDESTTVEVKDKTELKTAIENAVGTGRKVTVEQVSCGFTKEHFAAKPDLQSGDAQTVPAEEYCENCGKVMVLRRGPFGAYMACPDYNADPPCKTVRRLSQKQQQKPAVPLDEICPKCGKQLVLRSGSIRRVRLLLGLSEMQVHQAEPDRGPEVPEMRRGRHRRAQGAHGEHLLGLHAVSEV